MKSKYIKVLILGYLLLLIGFVVFSFAYIDLNLTLPGGALYRQIQNALIQLGYFQRNISTTVFVFFLVSFHIFYFFVLKRISMGHLGRNQVWVLIGLSSLLVLAYPAFSHDIFNYMFDARIVTKYHLSPYYFRALDFGADPWIRFMHWTHRYYPYGPGWLILSLVPSYLGMGKFMATLMLFKLMFLAFYLGSCKFIDQINLVLRHGRREYALALFALNPLVLIESLMSPHNEVVMLAFVLLSILLLIRNLSTWSLFFLMVSISIKFLSAVVLPGYILMKQISNRLHYVAYFWLIGVVVLFFFRQPYSWYIVPLIGLSTIIGNRTGFSIISLALASGTLARYIPFLFFGEYGYQTKELEIVLFTSVTLGTGIWLWYESRKHSLYI